MNVEISIIVPVYNVETTLDRCLQSILNQSFTDYEVILIDDGSTDSSGRICDDYVKQYSNFRVVHKTNEGLGPTRNAGMKLAKGKYIYHCDSDDWLEKDLLKKSHEAIESSGADVCIFGYDIYTNNKGKNKLYGSVRIESGSYTTKECIRKLFVDNYNNGFIVMTAWNRLYKKSFLEENELWFPALRRSQDMAYSLSLFDKLEKLVIIEESLYGYIIEPGVFKGRSYKEMIDIYINVNHMFTEQFEEWGMLDEKQVVLLNNRTCENIANYSAYAFVTKYPDQKNENIKTLLANEIVRKMFEKYVNNKKSRFLLLFCLAVKLKSSKLVWFISKLHEKKQLIEKRK